MRVNPGHSQQARIKRRRAGQRLLNFLLTERSWGCLAAVETVLIRAAAGRRSSSAWLYLSVTFLAMAAGLVFLSSSRIIRDTDPLAPDSSAGRLRRRTARIGAVFLTVCGLAAAGGIWMPNAKAKELLNDQLTDKSLGPMQYYRVKSTGMTPWGDQKTVISGPDGIRAEVLCPAAWGIKSGDRLLLPLTFTAFKGQQNPGGFDEASYKFSQGIWLKGKITGDFADAENVIISGPRLQDLPQRLADDASGRTALFFTRAFGNRCGGLAAAMLLGQTSRLDAGVKTDFRRAGLSHLLVVSGSNVSLILTLLLPLAEKSRLRWQGRLLIQLPLLMLFGALAGWDASVTRAIAMNLILCLARLLKRPVSGRSALELAVLLLVSANPLNALRDGFLMSGAVSFVLLTFSQPLNDALVCLFTKNLCRQVRWLGMTRKQQRLLLSLAGLLYTPILAQAAVIPFTVNMGQGLGWYTLPLNWAAVPLSNILTAILVLAAPLGIFQGAAGGMFRLLLSPCHMLLLFLVKLAGIPDNLQLHEQALPAKALWFLPVLWIIFLMFLYPSKRKVMMYACSAWSVLLAVLGIVLRLAQPELSVYFLAAGQGDAALIWSRSGQAVLIDTGPPGTGEIILQAMRTLGIDELDLIIVTHMHEDHSGGLTELIEAGIVRSIAWPDTGGSGREGEEERTSLAELEGLAGQSDTRHVKLSAGDQIVMGQAYKLSKIYPASADPAGGNHNSQVFLLSGNGLDVLFMGDTEERGETSMAAAGLLADIDILKTGHHGSRTSSTEAFLSYIRPEISVIPVGQNLYGHPDASVLEFLQDYGVFMRTDHSGAVRVRSYRNHWIVSNHGSSAKWKGN